MSVLYGFREKCKKHEASNIYPRLLGSPKETTSWNTASWSSVLQRGKMTCSFSGKENLWLSDSLSPDLEAREFICFLESYGYDVGTLSSYKMTTTFPQDSTYKLRIDAATKSESFSVFRELWMTPAEWMRIFLRMVAKTRSIPFALHIPNQETQESIRESIAGKKLTRFESTNQLFDHLDSLIQPHA